MSNLILIDLYIHCTSYTFESRRTDYYSVMNMFMWRILIISMFDTT